MITSLLRLLLTRSFKPFIFTNEYYEKIIFQNEKEIGLYVHIPFCRNICSFCPYCKTIYDNNVAKEYKTALLKEISMIGSTLQTKKETTSLYFGGGTPALMINDLRDIINTLKNYFIIHGGIGVELHPEDITKENLLILKNAGVTMVSLGIQSFNGNCLEKIGRKYSPFEEKIALVNQIGFEVIDVDLIFAIPGQTKEILLQDIETAFSYGATQISTYPFIDFTFADNKYKPLPEKNKKELLEVINNFCNSTDKVRTSVWTFAKKNSGKYSSVTRDNFLGFGVSATTLLRNSFKINTFSIKAYIDRINNNMLPTSLTLNFSLRQRAVYYIFWSIYGMKLNPLKFEELMGIPLKKLYGFELFVGKKLGFLIEKNGTYYLTDKGAYYYHYVEQIYTTAYIDKMWNISQKTDFPKQIILK
ncbi:MAG: radical SAM protein [Planctomycetaceae bacterium]|jgi:oxygen-independent coproporphyrinogen-3 oxidase|nr:radical SAM protein [Planctomycetaceae bacterium]